MTKDGLLEAMEWLSHATVRGATLDDILCGLCLLLNRQGAGVARASLSATTLHPLTHAHGVTWRPSTGAVKSVFAHGGVEQKVWLDSPLKHMLTAGLRTMRHSLEAAPEPAEYPVFTDFRNEGFTDWLACSETFEWSAHHLPLGELGMIVSWAADAKGGFSEQQVETLLNLTKPIAAAVKSRVVQDLAHNVLAAYLGAGPAEQVLSGAITRGSVTEIPAVLMVADIRNFTQRSSTSTTQDLVALINETFEIAAGPIAQGAGQILKFMGDGFLAIFLTDIRPQSDAVTAALDAALVIQRGLSSGVELDIAIHLGAVHYGNIGAAERLDFTVIGSAVNEVARMEALCSLLGHPILVSAAAAAQIEERGLRSLGLHRLRGFEQPREIFTPAAD